MHGPAGHRTGAGAGLILPDLGEASRAVCHLPPPAGRTGRGSHLPQNRHVPRGTFRSWSCPMTLEPALLKKCCPNWPRTPWNSPFSATKPPSCPIPPKIQIPVHVYDITTGAWRRTTSKGGSRMNPASQVNHPIRGSLWRWRSSHSTVKPGSGRQLTPATRGGI